MNNQVIIISTGSLGVILLLLFLLLSSCRDIEYKYDVPAAQADCPSGMTHRSGGAAIRDRSGGAAIRDRSGNDVSAYCEEAECPGGNWSADPADIDWHLTKGEMVIANRTCLAP